MVVSEDYMMLVYSEERKGSTGYAGRGGLGRTEDEAAFYRARAEAKVQGLRARRLKRRLEEIQEQDQREIEKLSRTLARVQKKNRNLTHQLRSIHDSRSWRLLDKLGRLRVRVLGRKP